MAGILADLLVRFKLVGKDELEKATGEAKAGMEDLAAATDKAGETTQRAMKAAAKAVKESGDQAAESARKMWTAIDERNRRLGLPDTTKAPAEKSWMTERPGVAGAAAEGGEGAEAAAGAGAALAPATLGISLGVAALVAAAATTVAVISKVTDSLVGLFNAGLQASTAGQILNFHLDRLARTVAGAFGPEIQMFTRWIEALTERLSRFANSEAFSRIMGVVDQVLEALGKLVDWILDTVEELADVVGISLPETEKKNRGILAASGEVGQMGSVESIWDRLAKASVMGTAGRDPQERAAKALEDLIPPKLDAIHNAVEKQRPAGVR